MFEDRWYQSPWVWIGAVLVFVVILEVAAQRNLDRKCARFMSFAVTKADSMQAAIACEKMRSDSEMAAAIAAGSGAIAGSAATRR